MIYCISLFAFDRLLNKFVLLQLTQCRGLVLLRLKSDIIDWEFPDFGLNLTSVSL